MNTLTDQELVHDYAQHGSEPAFAELVRRHVDLVYSAAVRISPDTTSAQDITQNVFIALAKNAKNLTDRPVLSGWLHQTTRNIAANTIRSEVRRRVREQEAATMNELLNSAPEQPWENIAPQLDDALTELSETDRDAILLRYFQSKTAQEIGLTLGITAEAAQKRVHRAVEHLRESLSKRELEVGAPGLALMISTNAVQSAPAEFAAGLAASVAASLVTVHSAAGIAAGKAFAISTLGKALIAGSIVAAAGGGLYEVHRLANSQTQPPVTLADAGVKPASNLQQRPDAITNPQSLRSSESRIAAWPGRKRAHEPTLAEAEEDLTNAIIQLGPDAEHVPDVWVQRGELQARTGKWNEAVTNLQQALVVAPNDAWAGYLLSSALLAGRNFPEYQKHSHAMMVTFGNTDNQIVGGRTSEAYLVAPYGDTTDLQMSVTLVERKAFYWWREFYQGLAQYRLGNFSAAADAIEADITKLPSVNQIDRPACEADCYLVLAMARRQLNQPAEAAAALAHGRQVVETQMPQPGGTDLGPYWWNGVTTRALLSEASETVEQWTPNPAKASFTFSLARSIKNAPEAKTVIPLTGPYSEPPAGPLHIVPESVTVNNGQMQFTIAGITPGATVCVLASGALFTPSSWVPISTNVSTSTTLNVSGIAATNAHEFFRILETR